VSGCERIKANKTLHPIAIGSLGAQAVTGVTGRVLAAAATDLGEGSRFAPRHRLAELRAEALTVQRPGTGIPASAIEQVIRRRVRLAVPAGTMLTWNMIGDEVSEEAA